MTARQIDNRISKLEALEAAKKELEAQIAEIKTAIQSEMGDAETMDTPKYCIKWTVYVRNTFDSKRFRTDHEKLYNEYTRADECRRFSYKTR